MIENALKTIYLNRKRGYEKSCGSVVSQLAVFNCTNMFSMYLCSVVLVMYVGCWLVKYMFLCLFCVSASDRNSSLGWRFCSHRAAAHQPPEVSQLHPEEPWDGPSQRRPREFIMPDAEGSHAECLYCCDAKVQTCCCVKAEASMIFFLPEFVIIKFRLVEYSTFPQGCKILYMN